MSGDIKRVDGRDILLLFDVDETITQARQSIEDHIDSYLQELRQKVFVGLVGGSDLNKIADQVLPSSLRSNCRNAIEVCASRYDYVFAENGLVAYKEGKFLSQQSIVDHLGEEKLQKFINFCLRYMSELVLPVKRGNFIEFRNSLINVCPVGRSCSQLERDQFNSYDNEHKIRSTFIKELEKRFGPDGNEPLGLKFSIGGQISFDAFPEGWDKTYCLNLIDNFHKEVHFFGDKTYPGGNDYEIFSHPKVIGHSVDGPADTLRQLEELVSGLISSK